MDAVRHVFVAQPAAQPHSCRALQYDTDVVTWSPQGRIHQIEYAMEAVKQGSAAVGLKVPPPLCLRSPLLPAHALECSPAPLYIDPNVSHSHRVRCFSAA